MIASLTIDPEQKELYFESLNILWVEELDDTYEKLTRFVKKIELKEIGQIQKESFSTIAGMRKKEAEEKLEDINSLSLLFNNI